MKKIVKTSVVLSNLIWGMNLYSSTSDIVFSGQHEEIINSPINNISSGDQVSLHILSLQDDAKVINNSKITTISTSPDVDGGTVAFGINVNSMTNNSSIINQDTIYSKSEGKEWVYPQGITVVNDDYDWHNNRNIISMQDSTYIINSGTIEVYGKAIYEVEVGGITGTLKDNAKIENSGIIKATAEVIDESSSEGEPFGNAFGMEIPSIKDNSQIINSGTILANVKEIGYHDSVAVGILNGSDEYDGARADGIISNSGTIKATINDKLDYRGLSLWTYFNPPSNVEIENQSSGKLYGNIVLNDNATLNNKGFISLPYNANKNANSIIDNVDEGYIESKFQPNIPNLINAGTIEIGAYKDSNNNIENTQIKTTNATFETGSKMQIAVVAGSKPFNMGDTLAEVVKSINKIEGVENIQMNQTKIPDSSALLNFELKYDETKNQIDLVVSKLNTLEEIEKEIEEESGSTIINNPSTPISTIFSYNATQVDFAARKRGNENILGQLQTVNLLDYENALESLVPTTQLSALNSSDQINSNISGIIFSRLQEIPNSGLNSGDQMVFEDDNRLWVKAFGSLGNQRDKDEVYGFDISTYGIGLGYDKEHMPNQFLGLAAFYTRAQIETNHLNHKNDINAYSVVAYGSNLLFDDKTTVYYQASYTWQKNDSARELFTKEKANSEFTSNTITTDLKVGHKINLTDQTSIEPKIGLEYSYYNSPVIKENGSKNGNLKTDKFNSEKLTGTIGADIEYKINNNSKIITTVKTGYDFKNDKNKRITSSFVNNPNVLFNSEGINNGRLSYEAGIAYEIRVDKKNNFNIAYKYIEEGKFSNNVLMLNYDYKF